MGLLDWVTLGRIDRDGASAGEFHLTLGTSWNATGGSSYEHVVGSSMNLTLDPVEIALSPAYAGGQAILGNTILGMGGSSDFVYGSSTQAIYGGPSFQLQRARDIEKKSDWFLRPKYRADSVPPPDPLEPTTAPAILVLSALINAVPLAMEIALYCAYKDYYDPVKDGPKKDDSKEDSPKKEVPIQKTPELLKFMAYGITTRLMAMVRTLEVATANGQIGAKLVEELRAHLTSLRNAVSFIIKCFKSNEEEAQGASWMASAAMLASSDAMSAMTTVRAW